MSIKRSDVLIVLMLIVSVTGMAGAILSMGAMQKFWLVDKPLALPFLIAWCLTAFVFTSVYLSLWTKGYWRYVSRFSVLISLLLLIAFAVAAFAYQAWTGQHVNLFSPLWFNDYNSDYRNIQLGCLLVSIAVIVGFPVIAVLFKQRQHLNNKGAHFQSHWELAKNKHFNTVGFPIGKASRYGDSLIWADTVALTLLAVTESFKTSSIVRPAIFTFSGSSINTDIKSELWRTTKGYLQSQGVKIWRWILLGDGTEENYARINPFYYVPWCSVKADGFLRMITRVLVPVLKDYENTIWEQASRDSVMAIATHLYLENHDVNQVTLGKIVDFVAEPDLHNSLTVIYDQYHGHKVFGRSFKNWIGKLISVEDVKLRNNLIYSIQKDVSNLFSPTVLASMDANDVDLRLLRKERHAIFINIPPGRSDEVQIFLNLFYNLMMILIAQMGEQDIATEPYKILLNMEEFGDMGSITKLAQGANTFRSFGVRFIFVLQNSSQLEALYGEAKTKTFLSSGILIKGGDNNHADNVLFSKMMGEKLVITWRGKGKERTKIKEYRPLMRPDEIRELSSKYWLGLKQGEAPMKILKIWDKKDFKKELTM